MVALWAEKEMRNLKRLWAAGIPCPEPLHLRLHVLVMGFLGDKRGWPVPRLKDAPITDPAVWDALYTDVLSYMRIMYHVCRLVHADLSEYNLLYHNATIFVIDVSQSVDHDHPRALEFLRMDVRNVNAFFEKMGVAVFMEKTVFEFVVDTAIETDMAGVKARLGSMERDAAPLGREEGEVAAAERVVGERVFRNVYIPRTLEQVYDVERDAEKVARGEGQGLIYKDLLATPDGGGGVKLEEEEEDDEEDDEEGDEDEDEEEVDEHGNLVFKEKKPRGKKHEDKDAKKVNNKITYSFFFLVFSSSSSSSI